MAVEEHNAAMPKGEQVNLQRTLTFVSFFYFTYSASKACLFPFLSLYLRQLGLSATQTGIIYGLKAFIALWAAPLWSSCATQYGRQRIVVMVAIFMTIASNLSLTLLPPADENLYFSFCHPGNKSNLESHGLVNSSQIDNNNVGSTTSLMPLGNQLSTTVNSIHTLSTHHHPFTEPPELNTKAAKGLHPYKPVTQQFKPPKKSHPKPSHAAKTHKAKTPKLHSPKLNGYKNSRIHQSSPNPIHFRPEDAEEPTHDDLTAQFQYNKDHFYNYNSVSDSERDDFTGNPHDNDNRKDYINIAKRSVSMKPDESSQNDQLPRSLESAQETLSKTITSFLEFEQLTFILILFIVVIGETLSCPVDKICDSSLYETLDTIDELDKYKKHNVPSIIGHGVFALIVTIIVDNTNCRIFLQASHFMIHFYFFAGLLGLTFLLAFFYPIPTPKKGNRKLRFCKGLKLLLGDPHNAVITLTMVITGALAANIHNFLFWHIQDLGGSEIVMGVVVLISVVSHIPMLFATSWVTRKLSQTGVLVLALLCLTVRLLYFAFLWTPWAVVPIEILCAFSQQALWETVTTYGEQISPPAMDRSIKCIQKSMYHGLGFAIGSALGGVIFDQAGLQILYGSSAAVALMWGVVVAVVARFVPKKKKLHYSSLLLREEEGDEEYLSDEDSDEVYGNDWLVKAMKDDF